MHSSLFSLYNLQLTKYLSIKQYKISKNKRPNIAPNKSKLYIEIIIVGIFIIVIKTRDKKLYKDFLKVIKTSHNLL